MPRRYPPLTPEEVIVILLARGFLLDRTTGSHAQYGGTIRGQFRRVTVDLHYRDLDERMIKRLILQSSLTREEFYGSTGESARKIGLRSDEYPVPLQ
jgi:predicted RNA binding protein YcfA (HicA-like mRNA interferase family)